MIGPAKLALSRRPKGWPRLGAGRRDAALLNDPDLPVRVDLHVQVRRSGGRILVPLPEQLGPIMGERGLSGLVLVEHDRLMDPAELAAINRSLPQGRVFRGAEISTSEGHCLVIGLPDLEGIQPGLSTWDLVKLADKHQAAVVLAHPLQPTPLTPKPVAVADMAPGIHAIEVVSVATAGTHELEARLIAHERGWVMVGGSDALAPQRIGSAFTALPRLPVDELELAALIRKGQLKAERAQPTDQ